VYISIIGAVYIAKIRRLVVHIKAIAKCGLPLLRRTWHAAVWETHTAVGAREVCKEETP